MGDQPKRESAGAEYRGSGMMVTVDGQVEQFREGAPAVRITGTTGKGPFALWESLGLSGLSHRLGLQQGHEGV